MHALSLVRGFFLVATPIIFTLTSLTAHAQTDDLPNIGLAPHSAGGYAPDAVIVKFRPSANASNKARARGLVNAVSNRQFKIVKGLEKLKLKKGQSVNQAVRRLQKLPFVEYAEPDYLVQATTNDELYGLIYAINNTGQDIRGFLELLTLTWMWSRHGISKQATQI